MMMSTELGLAPLYPLNGISKINFHTKDHDYPCTSREKYIL